MLTAEIILVNAVNNTSDFKDSERRSIGRIRLNLAKLGRDNRLSDCFDIRVGCIGKLYVRFRCNAKLLILVGILPNI